jgi:hypothetical protein
MLHLLPTTGRLAVDLSLEETHYVMFIYYEHYISLAGIGDC